MKSKLIDITKPVQTRDGRLVTQLVKFENVANSIVLYGVVGNVVYNWNSNGVYNIVTESNVDIFNVPEKKTVPLSFGDLEPGDWFRKKNEDVMSTITWLSGNSVNIAGFGTHSYNTLAKLTNWEYSKDCGKTWKPFSKEVEV